MQKDRNIVITTGGCPKLKIDRINIFLNTEDIRREQYVILENVDDADLIYAMQQIGMDLGKELVKELKEI